MRRKGRGMSFHSSTRSSHPCRECGDVVKQSGKLYCSNRCQVDWQYRCYIDEWKRGVRSGVQKPYGVSNYVRRYLTEKFGEKCARCSWSQRHPITRRVPLQIEHVDGCWENCHEDNLMLLCPNCHALTETFGALNKGRGRAARYVKL